jgi:thioredoxin 1
MVCQFKPKQKTLPSGAGGLIKMKKITFFVVFSLIFTAATFAQSGIKFEHSNWKAIVQKAKKENKLIFMDAYTTWCGPCKMLQANVFPNKELGDLYNANFVNLKMDMETPEGEMIADMFPIRAYPTLLYIDPKSGKVIKEVIGYQEVETLVRFGKQLITKKI